MLEGIELVDERVALATRDLLITHPRSPDELIDEQAFAEDEFLPYWAELWPSGIALARRAEQIAGPGMRVVELGCGLAVPSIAAALAGASVLATDWSTDGLSFARENARRNSAALETALVDWRQPADLVARGAWDLILAADVLYENRNVPGLLDLLPMIGERVLLADPGRPAAAIFLAEAAGSWVVRDLEPDASAPRVRLYELRRT